MNKIYKASRKSPSVSMSLAKRSLTVTLTDTSVVYSTGTFSKKSQEIPYGKINSVNVKQGMMERSLGYGDVIISTGNDVNGIVLENIEDPQGLKSDIMSMIKGDSTSAKSPAAPNDVYDEIEKLSGLRDKGIISSEDFESKKKQLLGL